MRRWIFLFEENKGQEEELAKKIGVSPFLARLLLNRGIFDGEQAKKFLTPKIEDLYDPTFYFPDFEKAISYLIDLRDKKEKILIFGDYDADGITATALLYKVLSHWGWNIAYYIPHRLEEGYGLKEKSLKRALEKNRDVKLVITADCGIRSKKEVEFLRNNGIEVIVTDHHIPEKEDIPQGLLVFDSYLSGYPFPYMAGVGVAFKFLKVLGDAIGQDIFKEEGILELVTLGTLGDMMELKDENRILVKYGLENLLNSNSIGIKALIKKVGLDHNTFISSKDLSFSIIPRINAIGRFKEVGEAVRLLITDDVNEAEELSERLEDFNRKRKEEVERVYEMAEELLKNEDIEKNRAVFLYHEDWGKEAGGIIGVVASMLADKYNLPFFLGRGDGDLIIGSGRGVEDVHLFNFISSLSPYLTNFGGHKGAVGFSLLKENWDEFKQKALEIANTLWKDVDFTPKIKIDAELSLETINNDFITGFLSEIDLLSPFGPGNEEPRFKINSTTFANFEKIGNGRRYKIKIGDVSGRVLSTPIFSLGIGEEALRESPQTVDIILRIEKEGYQGREYFNFYLEEWKESEVAEKTIKREKVKAILYFLENELEKRNLLEEIKKRNKKYVIVSPLWNKNFWEDKIFSPWDTDFYSSLKKDVVILWDDSELFLLEEFSQRFLNIVKNLKNPIIFLSSLKNEEKRLFLSDLLGIRNLRYPKRVFTPGFTDGRFSKDRDKDTQLFEGRDVYFYPGKCPDRVYKYLVFLKPPLTEMEFFRWGGLGKHVILLFGKDEFIDSYKRAHDILKDLEPEERDFFKDLFQNFLLFLQKARPSEIYSLLL